LVEPKCPKKYSFFRLAPFCFNAVSRSDWLRLPWEDMRWFWEAFVLDRFGSHFAYRK
jgi:hypothetical protein